MWLFRDLGLDDAVIFSDKEKADEFVKSYAMKMYDDIEEFPVIDRDYELRFYELNPDISYVDKFFD